MPTTMMEKVSIINSAIRTLLAALVLGGLGYGGWYGYQVFNEKDLTARRASQELALAKDELLRTHSDLVAKETELQQKNVEIGELHDQVAEQQQQIERLDTSLRLLKVDHRVARIRVAEQTKNADTGEVTSVIEFQEYSPEGEALDEPRLFEIKGDVVYIDTWVVKFEDKYVEQADLERSASWVWFRRIFGEFQEPREGFPLDEEGTSPAIFRYRRGGEMSEFEKKIWSDFWGVANNETKQDEAGIRAVQGEAPYLKVLPGKIYWIKIRASGGPSFEIDEDKAAESPTPA